MILNEEQRFNTAHRNLCPALRWKGQFIQAEPDDSVPHGNDRNYWCLHTQTCIGPDGKLAEAAACSSKRRQCHGTGKCD